MEEPGPTILSFDEVPVRAVDFEDLEAVHLVRDFLNGPERYLRGVWGG
jgi:predicted ATPase